MEVVVGQAGDFEPYPLMPASFESLPSELLLILCTFLDLEQLVHFSQVEHSLFWI
jgi:hypothetical protein